MILDNSDDKGVLTGTHSHDQELTRVEEKASFGGRASTYARKKYRENAFFFGQGYKNHDLSSRLKLNFG